VLVSETYAVAQGGVVNVSASLSAPGAAALFSRLRAAAAAGVPMALGAAALHALERGDDREFARLHGPAGEHLQEEGAPLPFESFGVAFSAFAFDGLSNFTTTTAADGTAATARVAGTAAQGAVELRVEVPPGRAVEWTEGPLLASRNGLVLPLFATFSEVTTATPTATYSFAAVAAATR
jgi:hypothetical protein